MKNIKQIAADIVHALQGLCHLPSWWAQRLHKRDPYLWTFGAWDGTRYSDNSRALFEYVVATCPKIKAVWMTHSFSILQRLKDLGLPVVLCETKEGRQIQKKAGFFITSNGVGDSNPYLLSGVNFINLWHGMPLKKIGNDAQLFKRRNTLFKRFKTECRRFLVPWEFMKGPTLSSSPFFTPFLLSAFELPTADVWETGLPRIDKFKSTAQDPLIQSLDERFNHPLKVLYMPTHRDIDHGNFNPFAHADYCASEFYDPLEKLNIVFLYKGHYFDRNVKEESSSNRFITISDNDYDDLYTFVRDVDVLITDYSSIYFDFLYLRKPIILFPFDEEAYVTKSRPFYFDYSLMEAKKVYSWQELMQCLATRDYHVPSDEEVERFCGIDNGKAHCEQIVEHIFSMISKQNSSSSKNT